ncbi:ATP-binding protein [Vibrio quintilis]|uniref:histidine kinase n=1 Tax=Vibrio quintilis TaxID=1117707 RepID=A0A1M7YQ62_9VIBR|nr:sensor histidine kinase [Vibrio quintilis]SHO54758.1 Sensor histidine kinase DpiB [Vibrio quintilis]
MFSVLRTLSRHFSLRQLRFKTRMIMILGAITLIQTVGLGYFALHYLDQALNEQMGRQAVQLAQTIAHMPLIREAISHGEPDQLQPFSLELARVAKVSFVVIGDQHGIRLAHPNAAKVGHPMWDDDGETDDQVLQQGQPSVSRVEGSLGLSMRGKAPVKNEHGQVTGIISVGYLLDTVHQTIQTYQRSMFVAIGLFFMFSVLTALGFSHHFKKAIFHLEPEQIGRMFHEQKIILETMREGIVAINQHGEVSLINSAALRALQLDDSVSYQGRHILDVIPHSEMLDVLQSGEPHYDEEIWLADHHLIVNRIPLRQNGQVMGVVSSFRLKNEVDLVGRKLTRIRQYAETLRSQSHEYNNKLNTIAGLIQIQSYDKALALIGHETQLHQSFIHQVMALTDDKMLAGCLLGKFNRARELGLRLVIDPDSQCHDIPAAISRGQLISIVSNLIDNAFEATFHHRGERGEVRISMTDLGHELILEVEDEGPGISEMQQQRIFDHGYTTKNQPGHGIGLHLVKTLVTRFQGLITIESPVAGAQGSRFTVYLPKEKQGNDLPKDQHLPEQINEEGS